MWAYVSQASDEDERPCWVGPSQLGPELLHLAEACGDLHCWHTVSGVLLDRLELHSHKHIQNYNISLMLLHILWNYTRDKHLKFIPLEFEIFLF